MRRVPSSQTNRLESRVTVALRLVLCRRSTVSLPFPVFRSPHSPERHAGCPVTLCARAARALETEERAMTERKRETKKSEWMDASDSAAYDPPTDGELEGLSLLGGNSLRDGAIGG